MNHIKYSNVLINNLAAVGHLSLFIYFLWILLSHNKSILLLRNKTFWKQNWMTHVVVILCLVYKIHVFVMCLCWNHKYLSRIQMLCNQSINWYSLFRMVKMTHQVKIINMMRIFFLLCCCFFALNHLPKCNYLRLSQGPPLSNYISLSHTLHTLLLQIVICCSELLFVRWAAI